MALERDDDHVITSEAREVGCDICGVTLDDAMAHLRWHVELSDVLQVLGRH